MPRKKIIYIILAVLAVLLVFRVQTLFTHISSSDYCYLTERTDYIESEDGTTHAEQNKYVAIESKGIRNYIFPYTQTVYIRNTWEGLKCENMVGYKVEDKMVKYRKIIIDAILSPIREVFQFMK